MKNINIALSQGCLHNDNCYSYNCDYTELYIIHIYECYNYKN